MRHTEFWERMEAALGPALRPRLGRPVRHGRPRAAARRRRHSTPACRPRRCGARCGRRSSCPRWTDDRHPSMLPDPVAVQRRTIGTLVVAQAVGAVGITIGIATASLLARDISGSESQAGLAQTFQVLGAAVASFLLARLMSRARSPGRPGHRLPARCGGRRAGRRSPASSTRWLLLLVGAVLLGLDDGRQQRRALRRHRPRPGASAAPARCRPSCGRPPSAPSPAPT